ncbi:NADPH-dependent FMN reductase [Streptomyces spirodelae]|uniref:NAD(P)H-dependent oxidoreductase n=1 Tax=Streptomyces spirodelae TaxID=2812904 RepID=A0ABS3WRV1_9ACTN|nr:NAD(P)H-dependent oxidoreductase [Streptomyces spirodelae]MBO8185854.1 NAD(P)H-dependent oxidoreductase [Streptomyces spirodelae]
MREVSVLAISGSLRARSYNSALAQAAQKHAPKGVDVGIYEGLRDIPPFDEDFETGPPPAPVADLRRRIDAADALLVVTPEYNGSFPGVLKNALDWASRPAGRSSLQGKTVAIAGASPSNFGTSRAQLALRQVFLSLDARIVAQPEVMVFRAHERIDDAGNLTDETSVDLLRTLVEKLAGMARAAAA